MSQENVELVREIIAAVPDCGSSPGVIARSR
jgi:hypothetical protein